MAYNVLL